MNCKAFEKEIYGFKELPAAKQRALTEHMQSCQKCLVLYTDMMDSISRFSEQYAVTPAYDENRLIANVMRSLPPRTRRATVLEEPILTMMSWLRPAMTVAAVFLAGFFMMEVMRSPQQINRPVVAAGSVKLDRQMTANLATHWLGSRSMAGTNTLDCFYECQKLNENTCFECLSNKKQ